MINFLRTLCIIFFAAVIGSTAFADSHRPPLHLAIFDGNIAEAKRLINGGADINIKNYHGLTPLHLAVSHGQTEIALALIKAGADINGRIWLDAFAVGGKLWSNRNCTCPYQSGGGYIKNGWTPLQNLQQKKKMAGRLCILRHFPVKPKLHLLLSKQGRILTQKMAICLCIVRQGKVKPKLPLLLCRGGY